MRSVRSVISAVTPGLPSRSPPIQLPQRRNAPTRGGRAPVRTGVRACAGATARRRIQRGVQRPASRGASVNSVASKNGHRRPDLVERRRGDRPQVGRPPQERDLLAQPATDLAILGRGQARIVEPREQDARSDAGRPGSSGGGPRSGARSGPGDHGRPASCASSSASVRPERAQPADRLRDRIVQDAVARRPLASAQRPDAAARLGQVDQLEVQREGADDGLGRRPGRGPPGRRPGARARRGRPSGGARSSGGGCARRGRTGPVRPARR